MDLKTRYQPENHTRADGTLYRIMDVRDQTFVSGFARQAWVRDHILESLRLGYTFKHALYCACLRPGQWIFTAGEHPFARFAQMRSLAIEYPLLVTCLASVFTVGWHRGRPIGFVNDNVCEATDMPRSRCGCETCSPMPIG